MLLPYTKITKLVKYQKVILSSKCLNTIFFSKFQCRGTIPFTTSNCWSRYTNVVQKWKIPISPRAALCVCGAFREIRQVSRFKILFYFCEYSTAFMHGCCKQILQNFCALYNILFSVHAVFSVHGLHGCRMEYRFFASRTAGLNNFTSLQ